MIVVYVLGDVSGAHTNRSSPSRFALRGGFDCSRASEYVLAQCADAAGTIYLAHQEVSHSWPG